MVCKHLKCAQKPASCGADAPEARSIQHREASWAKKMFELDKLNLKRRSRPQDGKLHAMQSSLLGKEHCRAQSGRGAKDTDIPLRAAKNSVALKDTCHEWHKALR